MNVSPTRVNSSVGQSLTNVAPGPPKPSELSHADGSTSPRPRSPASARSASCRLSEWQAWADKDEDDSLKRMDAKVRMWAYVLTAKRDGWRRFCAEFQVDPDLLLNDVPAYDTVKRSEEAARLLAFRALSRMM